MIDEEEERGNSRLHLEIMDKQNVEELRQELKNLDWSKYARYQSMTAEEMIVCDEKVDCCKDFTTKDIYDIVTGKEELEEIIEEGVNNEVIKISNKEASRAIDLLASLLLSNRYEIF